MKVLDQKAKVYVMALAPFLALLILTLYIGVAEAPSLIVSVILLILSAVVSGALLIGDTRHRDDENLRGKLGALNRVQGVIEFELDGTIITANENFLNTLGYTLDEVVGKHHSIFVEEAYKRSPEYKQFWASLNRGDFLADQFKRIKKDGSEVWIEASYNPVLDEQGKPVSVIKFAIDITDQKLERADFEGQLQAISKSQAVIEFKLDGTILNANDNFLSVMGYKLDEIKGRHHSIFVEKEFSQSYEYKTFWEKLNQGEYQAAEYLRIGKDDKQVWIQASYNPIFDMNGKPFKVVKYATDVTERKCQEVENKRIANMSSALNICQACMMMTDLDFNIVYVNDEMVNLFRHRESELRKVWPGFSADKLLGSNIDQFHKQPEHQRRMLSSLTEAYLGSVNIETLTFGLAVKPWFDLDGVRIGTIVQWLDRTAEVAIEKEIAAVVDSAAAGDFTKQIILQGKEGFFANLGNGLNQLLSTIEVSVNDVVRVLGSLAKGDLTERITRDYQGAFGQLKEDVNTTAEKLTEVICNIRESSSSITASANEISQGNTDLSQRTEEQASALEETASSMEEMTSTVRQSAENAVSANTLAIEAQEKAKQGGVVVSKAVESMEEINKASKRIADIIGVIDEIAFQTNLLALNAAVEAARAGEQGRGFAVVAGEVRNLAQRSAGAAKEIKDLIRDSVIKVEDGSQLVNASGETLQQIVAAVEKVTSIMRDISDAAQEQTSGIEQVNTAVSEMDEMTQQNAALVEQASAASEAMAEQARNMNRMMDFFTVDNEGYVQSVSREVPLKVVKKLNGMNGGKPQHLPKVSNHASVAEDDWEEF